jgi:hypothetical protein
MSPKLHVPGTLIVAWPRYCGACMAFGVYAVVLLVPSTWTLAATQVDSNAVGANESSLFIAQDTRKTGQWKIIRIVPPENSQELGTVIFGEGESFLEPSALRGPR